jgi:hypothetical protein
MSDDQQHAWPEMPVGAAAYDEAADTHLAPEDVYHGQRRFVTIAVEGTM